MPYQQVNTTVRQGSHLTVLFCLLTSLTCTSHLQGSTLGATGGGANLGQFSLLSESATQGNSLTLAYGVSTEGNSLITYWHNGPDNINVVVTDTDQYALVEGTGNRCFTVDGTSVHIATCTGSAAQAFALAAQADGSYTIRSSAASCITAPGPFSVVAAAPCNASASQRWNFTGATTLNLKTQPPAPVISPAPAPGNPIVNSPTVPAGYHLTFDDEFQFLSISDVNGAGTKWYTHTVQCCMHDTSNPSTPTFMAGITDPVGHNPYSLVPGGGLDIRLQKTNGAWYSGVIASVDHNGAGFSQRYGYFEMKAKFPPGQGTWPAFWFLNSAALSNGAPAGEIDAVESYMFAPNYINTTLHDWSNGTTVGYKLSQTADLSRGFHVFGMLWTATTITFYVDGAVVYQLPTPAIMHQPYYPIIDLGIGGGWPTNQIPQQSDLIVQYMRAYSN